METKYKTDVGHIAYTPGVRIVQSSITMFALEVSYQPDNMDALEEQFLSTFRSPGDTSDNKRLQRGATGSFTVTELCTPNSDDLY